MPVAIKTGSVGPNGCRALEQFAGSRTDGASVTRLGVLTAAIAHEVKQPLTAIVTNGETSLRCLARADLDVEKIRELTRRVIANARRASEIVDGIRAMTNRR